LLYSAPRLEKLIAGATDLPRFPVHPKARIDVPTNAWLINFCVDADEYSRAMTFLKEFLTKTCMPAFNHPDGIINSRRDNVSTLLQGIHGLTAPKCVRFHATDPAVFEKVFRANEFTYPVLIRPTASQSGSNLVRVASEDEWDKVHTIPWGGAHLYITQFVDFKNVAGENLKLRVVCAGDKIYVRHVLIGQDWLIHAMDRTDEIVDREFLFRQELLENPLFLAMVKEIKARVGLDFFGIDLGWMGKDQFVLFEANAAMSILSTAHMPIYRRAENLQVLKNIEEGVVSAIRAVQFRASKATRKRQLRT
jgi:glutathione synthase/RimK-type ligase-like ATP-grasp enzyme